MGKRAEKCELGKSKVLYKLNEEKCSYKSNQGTQPMLENHSSTEHYHTVNEQFSGSNIPPF